MHRQRNDISIFALRRLQAGTSDAAGFSIRTKSDCLLLSSLIQSQVGASISQSTIYRLFFMPGKYQPYIHTLDLLSQFSGFTSWETFQQNLSREEELLHSIGKPLSSSNRASLLEVCIHGAHYTPLHHYMEQLDGLSFSEKYILGHEIYKALEQQPSGNIAFFKSFHNAPIVRECFFELLADPSFSLKDYDRGLRLYLEAVLPENNLQDYIFGHAMLLRHYFIAANSNEVLKIGRLLYLDVTLDRNIVNELHIFPRSRYWACAVLYEYLAQGIQAAQRQIESFLAYIAQVLPQEDMYAQRVMLYHLIDCLILTQTIGVFEARVVQLFNTYLRSLPSSLREKPLEQLLHYIEVNGSLIQRNLDKFTA